MTADEIRNVIETIDPDPDRPEGTTIREMTRAGHSSSQFVLLREIAAQLAELNERLRPGNLEVNIYDCSFEGSKKAGQK